MHTLFFATVLAIGQIPQTLPQALVEPGPAGSIVVTLTWPRPFPFPIRAAPQTQQVPPANAWVIAILPDLTKQTPDLAKIRSALQTACPVPTHFLWLDPPTASANPALQTYTTLAIAKGLPCLELVDDRPTQAQTSTTTITPWPADAMAATAAVAAYTSAVAPTAKLPAQSSCPNGKCPN